MGRKLQPRCSRCGFRAKLLPSRHGHSCCSSCRKKLTVVMVAKLGGHGYLVKALEEFTKLRAKGGGA